MSSNLNFETLEDEIVYNYASANGFTEEIGDIELEGLYSCLIFNTTIDEALDYKIDTQDYYGVIFRKDEPGNIYAEWYEDEDDFYNAWQDIVDNNTWENYE